MLRFIKLSQRPRVLYRFTGLPLKQFITLSEKLKPLWEQAEKNRLSRRNRKHVIGQGRKYKLPSIDDKLLFILVFYRFYLTDELLGYLFGFDKSNVCRMREKMEPLLEKGTDPSLRKRKIPSGAKKISSLKELLEVCPEFAEVITDATKQHRRRPQKKVQKRYYSGKKKHHTIKTQITVNTQGKILLVSKSYPGRVHDYNIFKKENTAKKVPPKSMHYVERGYDGVSRDYPDCHISMPIKRRRSLRILTRIQKRFNKQHSRVRVIVEHVLSRMKKYQMLAQVYRHKMKDYSQRFRNIAGLINFRLETALA